MDVLKSTLYRREVELFTCRLTPFRRWIFIEVPKFVWIKEELCFHTADILYYVI